MACWAWRSRPMARALLIRLTGAQLDWSRNPHRVLEYRSRLGGRQSRDAASGQFGRGLFTGGPLVDDRYGIRTGRLARPRVRKVGQGARRGLSVHRQSRVLAGRPDAGRQPRHGRDNLGQISARQLSFIALEPPPDSLEFSSDGARLAGTTWIRHDLVFINDVRSDRPTVCFAGITGEGMHYSLSPDGRTLASAGIGLPAALWDTSNGQKKVAFTGAVREINALVFAPDGKSVFLGCGDGLVRAWRTAPEPPPVRSLDGCTDQVWSLAFAPDGDSLFSAADDHLITVWNPRTGLRRRGAARTSGACQFTGDRANRNDHGQRKL